MPDNLPPDIPVIVIGGPTASGKSGLAITLARHFNGCIINADSIQLYQDLPTLTARPAVSDTDHIPHRLYGFLSADEKTDAACWRDWAAREIHSAYANGLLPIVVGGTGFYIAALLQGFSPIPAVPDDIRTRITRLCDEQGIEKFYAETLDLDPKILGRIDPHNPRRVMRAREVYETTGISLIDWQAQPKSGPPQGMRFFTMTVLPDRDALYDKCNKRFEMMLDHGAIDEVRDLKARINNGEISSTPPVTRALGYTEIRDMLAGDLSRDAAMDKATQITRNYAKRQSTWFRNQLTADLVLDNAQDSAHACEKITHWRAR